MDNDRQFGTEKFGWGRDGRVGRPPMYDNPEDLQEEISNYFNAVANGEVDNQQIVVGVGDKRKVISIPKPTITGLVLFCGFADRYSFYEYEKKPEFTYTIKRARSFIEHDYELQIRTQTNPTGAIFALKNFGWKDTQEIKFDDDDASDRKAFGALADMLNAEEGENGHRDTVRDDSEAADNESD